MLRTKLFFNNRMGSSIPAIECRNSGFKPGQPLVIALHGNGEIGELDSQGNPSKARLDALYNNNNFSNLMTAGDNFGFNVFCPQFIQAYNYTVTANGDLVKTWLPEWAGGWYIYDAIQYAISTMQPDKTRIYLTGLSGGGGGCWSYITTRMEFVNLIAACVPICGTEPSGERNWDAAKTIPIWAFHGEKDITINVSASVRQCAASNGKLTIIPSAGHSIWGQVYGMQDLYPWMLSKVKLVTPPPPPPDPTPTPVSKEMQSVHVDLTKDNVGVLFKDGKGDLSGISVDNSGNVEHEPELTF